MNAFALDGVAPKTVPQLTGRGKVLWTVGNLLMLVGFYLLLYVGGLFADEQYNIMAAEGTSDVVLHQPTFVREEPVAASTAGRDTLVGPPIPIGAGEQSAAVAPVVPNAAPRRFVLPRLNDPGGGVELNTLVPKAVGDFGPSTISRLLIPKINVDKKVVEVGWSLQEIEGQQVAVWEVAKYAVGHHTGSANPGQIGNLVLAGHSGGRAYPFNDLYYLEPGDTIAVWSNDQEYEFTVKERLVVDEIGPNVTAAQRQENARYIEPTDGEVMTLVTCWPLSGPDKFNQRVIIRAVPNRPTTQSPVPTDADLSGGWTAR